MSEIGTNPIIGNNPSSDRYCSIEIVGRGRQEGDGLSGGGRADPRRIGSQLGRRRGIAS